MNPAWIGLGSNLGASMRVLEAAVVGIGNLEHTQLQAVSPSYRTPPWGGVDQPDFVNAVVQVETAQTPGQLLENLLQIESELGRTRDGARWGPRVIDLDVLVYAESQLNEPDLIVPHPRLHERAFALMPLHDLSPELEVPGRASVRELLQRLDPGERDRLKVIAEWDGSGWITHQREVS